MEVFNVVGTGQMTVDGVEQYQVPKIFHFTGMMGEQGVISGNCRSIQVKGSAKASDPLTATGMSIVQLGKSVLDAF